MNSPASYKLYYYQGLASLAPHFVLREIGEPFELVNVDRSKGQHKTSEYLELNPNGRIPTFRDGNFVLFESAAICLHLADSHTDKNLFPRFGSGDRSEAYQWLIFLTNTLQADLWQFFRPELYVPAERQTEFKSTMADHIGRHLRILDAHLAGKNYMVGESITICDLYLLMLGRWSRHINPPTRNYANVSRVLESLCHRRAIIEAFDFEEIAKPYF